MVVSYCRAQTSILMQIGVEDYANVSGCADTMCPPLECGSRAGSWEVQPLLPSLLELQGSGEELELPPSTYDFIIS